jgi:uncharacterized membrane protein YebE (DUF533 family)
MFDATKLLGTFVEGRSTGSMPDRMNAAIQQGSQSGMLNPAMLQSGDPAAGGGLGALLGGLLGGGQASADPAAGSGGGLFGGLMGMARRAMGSPGTELAQNNPAAVGGLGALAGALLGGGRGAVGGGLMAVLGSLAYSAFQNAQNAPQNAPAAAGAGPTVQPMQGVAQQYGSIGEMPGYNDPNEVQRKATLMFRAMVQAAKADGNLDEKEAARLTSRLGETGDAAEAQKFVEAEMNRPVDVQALAADVRTPQEAGEVYAASLMAIDVDTDAERQYLADLAVALKLPPQAVDQMHSSLNVTPGA